MQEKMLDRMETNQEDLLSKLEDKIETNQAMTDVKL
jgi:hypothetical protein